MFSLKRILACFLTATMLIINLSVVSFANSSDKEIPIPYTLSDSIDYNSDSFSLPTLSGEVPKYFYNFYNDKTPHSAYSLLDDCQKKMYDYIVNAPKDNLTVYMTFEYGEFPYSNFVREYLWEVMYAICNDRPDLFYYNGYSIQYGLMHDNTCIETLDYTLVPMDGTTYSASNISSCFDDLTTAVKSVPVDTSNRYNFVKSVHDYLCETIYYPDLNSPDYTGNAHDAYGALIEKTAVCQGYADAFKLICDYYKIPSVCITGTANGGAHMWNAVQMDDGLWYLLDATWDDQTPYLGILDDFFLIGLNTIDTHFDRTPFSQSHISDSDLFLPVLKYANEKYQQTNHFTEFSATYNSIAKKEGNYLIRSYFDVYDSSIYYDGMYVEVNSPATNSTFVINNTVEQTEEEWRLVSICDCNGDGLADVDDYAEAVNKVMSDTQVSTVFDMAADADCDGYLDVIDLAIIERAVSRKNTNIILQQ